MSTLLAAACVALALPAFFLHYKLRGSAVAARSRSGCFQVELRRRTSMVPPPAAATRPFPVPREIRWLVYGIGGVPLWKRSAVIALPSSVEDALEAVPAEAFDHHFPPSFRVTAIPEGHSDH